VRSGRDEAVTGYDASPHPKRIQGMAALTYLRIRDRSYAKVGSDHTWGDYGRSDSVTIMGVWSDGFSCARGPLSISQPLSRSASGEDN
jgi:hypothetical protein